MVVRKHTRILFHPGSTNLTLEVEIVDKRKGHDLQFNVKAHLKHVARSLGEMLARDALPAFFSDDKIYCLLVA